jgi:hypothetical protein
VLFAVVSDRLTAVVRQAALGEGDGGRSAWATGALYLARLVLAPVETARGLRRAVLEAAPLPGAIGSAGTDQPATPNDVRSPAQPATSYNGVTGTAPRKPRPRGKVPGKTARFLSLVAERHGPLDELPLERVSRIAADLAPEVRLDLGSARRELRAACIAARGAAA